MIQSDQLFKPRVAVPVSLVAVLVFSGWLSSLQGDYPGDDSLIHLRCAHNFAEYGNVSFNPGEKSFSTTSPLWNVIVGSVARVTNAQKSAMRGLSDKVALLVLALAAVAMLLLSHTLYERWLPLATVLFLLDPYVTATVHGAMEQTLFIALGAFGFALAVRGGDGSRKALVGAAVVFALQYTARPEALAFAGATVIHLWWRRRLYASLLFGASFVAALVPVLVLLHHYLDSAVPLSLLMKTHDAHGWRPFSATGSSYRILVLLIQVYAIPLVVLSALIVLQGRHRGREYLQQSTLPILIIVLLGGTYLGFLKENAVSSRYLVHFMPFVYLLIAGLLQRIGRPGLTATVATSLALYLVAINLVAAPKRVARGLQLEPERIELGIWLSENTPADTSVWTFDIGYIGFYSGRRIYDFNLVSSDGYDVSDALNRRRGKLDMARTVRSSGIRFLIWGPRNLPDLPMELLFTSRHEREAGRRSIYRILYDGDEGGIGQAEPASSRTP
ncbi:MAG: hypothetical protein GY838_19865 [bacterium]|nr:hypothetical protein [bacterium]